jgi:hypothetical protein
MNARRICSLVSVSMTLLAALVGCGSAFMDAPDGGDESDGDGVTDSKSPSDGTSSSETGTGADASAGSDAGGSEFQCADKTSSCLVGTRFCLYDAILGTTSCQLVGDCKAATDPCTCVAVATAILRNEDCTASDDSPADECQISCVRRKDAGSADGGSGSGDSGSTDGSAPHDASAPPDSSPPHDASGPPDGSMPPPKDAGGLPDVGPPPKDAGPLCDVARLPPGLDGGVIEQLTCLPPP